MNILEITKNVLVSKVFGDRSTGNLSKCTIYLCEYAGGWVGGVYKASIKQSKEIRALQLSAFLQQPDTEAINISIIALWQSCNISEKSIKKVSNFGNWFLCQFSPKMYQFLHEGFLTPQEWGDEKIFKKWHAKGGKKGKNVKGMLFTDKTGLNLILSQK